MGKEGRDRKGLRGCQEVVQRWSHTWSQEVVSRSDIKRWCQEMEGGVKWGRQEVGSKMGSDVLERDGVNRRCGVKRGCQAVVSKMGSNMVSKVGSYVL